MKPKSTIKILLSLFFIAIINKSVDGQITLLQDYQNRYSAPIGTFQGINFRESGFSGLFPIPNTNGKEFWTVSDRGVNVDGANANLSGCRPTYDKIYGFANYVPKIHRIRINGDSIQIMQTITMKRPGGTGASGLLNPVGFGSTAAEVISTDTVLNCSRFNLKTASKDIWGIDAEGIVVDKDGNFWICEEGGPTIWKLNQYGMVIKRYTPYANLVGAQSIDVQIDSCFKYRKNNRGFEGIALTPNGNIYAFIQSPLLYPNTTIGESTRMHRILEINPATNAQKMYVYMNDGIIGASGSNQIRLRDWKLGDATAINDSTFLVLEAAARGTSDIKRLYQINIKNATAINSGLYSAKTLEALADSVTLAANSIKPVTKTLVMDLLSKSWPSALDKAEGLAILNDSTIAICNDNDYGQTCPLADGIAIPTSNTSHLITFSLKGINKLKNFKTTPMSLKLGTTGPSSSQTPYLIPVAPGVKVTSILSVGDAVNGYKMCGIPDGLGAYDNGNGTFTVLMNHEIGNTLGVARAHGAKGAFVSKLVINKADLSVVAAGDLIQKVNLWNGTSYTLYNPADTTSKKAFTRFCSADLPAVSAFYNAATGLGTQERIFMNGEESGNEGRAFAHIATGTNAGTTYELPLMGKYSFENAVALPYASNKTVVAGTDDATPGQVYFYIGTKTNSGTEIDKAGLTNGKLYGVAVNGLLTETSSSIPSAGTAFTLVDLGQVQNSTGAALNTASNTAGVTSFLRPEDGAWDPANPSDFYFNTTNAITSPSRLWRLHFSDITNPAAGGTITAVLDGTEGQKMLDNITIDNYGHALLVEDVGNNAHIGRVLQYDITTDAIKTLAEHDQSRFLTGSPNFLTQDEEASGILDVQEILGPGMFLVDVQAHYALAGELVEGGQLLALYNPETFNSNPEIAVLGNGSEIKNNNLVTNAFDNTNYGNIELGTNISKTFQINNSGIGSLKVSSIAVSGANSSEFTIENAPSLPLTIAPGTSLNLSIKFTPSANGLRNASLNVLSNDFDEKTYNVALEGRAVSSEINVQGNNVNIANNDLSPIAYDNTDFGSVTQGSAQFKTYTIQNTGSFNLTLNNATISGTNASEFIFINNPSFPLVIAPNNSLTLIVQFTPTAIGVRNANLTISNTDADEGTYTFALKGTGSTNTAVKNLNSNNNTANVYPNPADNETNIILNLVAREYVVIKMIDLQGKEILTTSQLLEQGINTLKLNTSELKSGIYFIEIKTANNSTRIKTAIIH